MLPRRAEDLFCIHESRWRGVLTSMITGKVSMYRFFWVGNPDGTGGVHILLKEVRG